MRLVRGCLGRLAVLVVTAAVLAVAWSNRHALTSLWDRVTGREPEASPALAEATAAKLEGVGRNGVTRVAFHEAELQSLVEYRWAALVDGLVSPRVGLGAGRVTLEGGVPTTIFRGVAELQEVLAFLPDTTRVRAEASVVPLEGRHVAVEVHEMVAAGIPIPRRLIPAVVARFRVAPVPGIGPNVVAVPLPARIGNVYVSGDSLVVSARSGGG
ncbi:MAG: hypothetical protein ACOCUW_02190 [Gemmatimonadota bacterium]